MPRKIYDIKPPKLVKKVEKDDPKGTPEFFTEDKKPRVRRTEKPVVKRKKERKSILLPIIITIFVVLLIIAIYLFFKLPKAEITIWPKVDTLSFKQTITADKSVDTVDLEKSAIPAQYFQVTKTNSQDFPATGNASNEGMAKGNITIYNKYEPVMPFTFRAGTHFMSDSGKLFITFQKVVIPAAKKSGGKIIPGSVQIEVQAVEGGADYNIAPSKFSVPGLKGTAYYYSVYATSTEAMTGGYTGKVKKVTSDDIQGAKDVLTKKTTDDALLALQEQISSEYILLDSAILSDITSASTQTKAGAIADNFNYEVTVKASAVAFKKADIEKFAKDYIISKMPENKVMLEDSLATAYSASVVDVSGGKATINLDISSGVYQNIDKNSLKISLFGKNSEQIKQVISNTLQDQLLDTQVKLWPFWVTKAPNSQKVVNIDLKFQ
jgi:hypothetical protein